MARPDDPWGPPGHLPGSQVSKVSILGVDLGAYLTPRASKVLKMNPKSAQNGLNITKNVIPSSITNIIDAFSFRGGGMREALYIYIYIYIYIGMTPKNHSQHVLA